MPLARRLMFTLVLAALPCWSSNAHERVLVPVWEPEALPGAFGTEWVTELFASNVSEGRVEVRSSHLPCRSLCPREDFDPGEVWAPRPFKTTGHPPDYLYVDSVTPAEDVQFSLRVYDRSLGFGTWGAQVPVVFESEAWEADRKLMLLNVPVSDAFRLRVRIYSFDEGRVDREFKVVVRSVLGGEVLFTQTWATRPPVAGSGGFPGYLELGGNDLLISDRSEPVVIEIEPLEGEQRFWAFASVTHNELQHVTIIAP